MMRRWSRLLPLLITALWLPLQAVAGIAMPFCQHAAERAAALDAAAPAAHGEHCSGHAAADMDCDNCELCHFAASGYLLPAEPVAASAPVGRDFTPRPLLASPSFIPEPPQQPPKRPS